MDIETLRKWIAKRDSFSILETVELLELCAAKCAIIPNMSTHYTIGQFSEIVGVCVKTLQRWDREGRLKALRTHTNRRYYLDSHLSQVLGEKKRSLPRKVVVYCRVSSRQQATHLKNQRLRLRTFVCRQATGLMSGFWNMAVE